MQDGVLDGQKAPYSKLAVIGCYLRRAGRFPRARGVMDPLEHADWADEDTTVNRNRQTKGHRPNDRDQSTRMLGSQEQRAVSSIICTTWAMSETITVTPTCF